MKKGNLPIGWVRWRRRRYLRLEAQGLPGDLAWRMAAGEAAGRHRVSHIIGNYAARNAEMICISTDGKLRFQLVGDLADISDEQAAAIEKLSLKVAGKPA